MSDRIPNARPEPADALAKAYRDSQQNGRSGARRPRRAPLKGSDLAQTVSTF